MDEAQVLPPTDEAPPPDVTPAPDVTPTPPVRHRWRTPVILAVVVAVIVAGWAVWFFGYRDDPSRPVAAGRARTPQAAMRGYLQALAAGNAADALSFADTLPSDQTFLTDAVLAASLAIAPITGISTSVSLQQKTSASVQATYSIGATQVTTSHRATKTGGYWFIAGTTYTSSDTWSVPSAAGLALNGVPVSAMTTSVSLFPGSYSYTITNTMLSVANTGFVVKDGVNVSGTTNPGVKVTDQAQATIGDAIASAVNDCAASKQVFTSCGFGKDFAPPDIDPASITWSPYPDPSTLMDNAAVQLVTDDTVGTYGYGLWVNVTANVLWTLSGTVNGKPYNGGGPAVTQELVNIDDPAHIVVIFQARS